MRIFPRYLSKQRPSESSEGRIQKASGLPEREMDQCRLSIMESAKANNADGTFPNATCDD